MTRQIFVDSRDRISGTPSNFTILLKHTLNTTDRPHTMRVDHLRLLITVPTLTDQTNVLTVSVNGGASFISVEMPARQYDAISFPQIIRDRLTALVPSRTWTVGYDLNRISLTISANGSFLLDDSGSLNRRLKQHLYVDGGNFYEFTYCPLNGADVIFLCSDQFSSVDTHGPAESHDVLLPCNITAPFGSVQVFSSSSPSFVSCPPLSTNTLSFQLRDRSHTLLTSYLQNVSFLLTID
jgi:hypothetical protein